MFWLGDYNEEDFLASPENSPSWSQYLRHLWLFRVVKTGHEISRKEGKHAIHVRRDRKWNSISNPSRSPLWSPGLWTCIGTAWSLDSSCWLLIDPGGNLSLNWDKWLSMCLQITLYVSALSVQVFIPAAYTRSQPSLFVLEKRLNRRASETFPNGHVSSRRSSLIKSGTVA